MLEQTKKALLNLIRGLGYNITDTGAYREQFPWLMIRTGRFAVSQSRDVRREEIILMVDVFSSYPGEKEIVAIAEDIAAHIEELRTAIPEITTLAQTGLKILDDKATGPVRKHGVLSYQFILTFGLQEGEADDETANPTGD